MRDDKVCLKPTRGGTSTCATKKHANEKAALVPECLCLTVPSGKSGRVLLGQPSVRLQDLATHDSLDAWLQEEHPIDVWVKCFADRKAKVSFGTLDSSPSEESWENVVEPIPLREVASAHNEVKTPLKFESRLRAVKEALGTQSHLE